MKQWRGLIMVLFLAATAFGQMWRWAIVPGGRGAVTAGDIVLIVVSLGLLMWLVAGRQFMAYLRFVWSKPAWRYIVLFLVWALVSLILGARELTTNELLISGSYWLRLLAVIFSLTSLSLAFENEDEPRLRTYFIVFATIMVVAGFTQVVVAPDFSGLTAEGWDPHLGRLLSTFYDPNYFAAYLVLVMAVTLGLALKTEAKTKWLYALFFAVTWVALYLTYSRSGWLMGFLAIPLVAWPRSRYLGAALGFIFVVTVFLPNRLGGRIQQSTSFVDVTSVDSGGDASAAARAESTKQAWALAQDHIVTGVGFNSYGFALSKGGYAPEGRLQFRSGMGTDNSWLFVLATTGVIGLGLYLAFYLTLLRELWQKRFQDALAWSLFAFMTALTIGAFFNNLFFYTPLLLTMNLLLAWQLRNHDQ